MDSTSAAAIPPAAVSHSSSINGNDTDNNDATRSKYLVREQQRNYVKDIKEQLHVAMKSHGGLSDDDRYTLQQIGKGEKQTRRAIVRETMGELEMCWRAFIVGEEQDGFRRIHHRRKQDSLVPWCTNSCRYCCMHRVEWEVHVRNTFDHVKDILEQSEGSCREHLTLEANADFNRVTSEFWNIDQLLALLSLQRASVEAEYLHVRGSVTLEQDGEYGAIIDQVQKKLAVWRAANEASALRDRHLEVLNIQDRLGLQERRVFRQSLVFIAEEEHGRRNLIISMWEARTAEIGNKKQRAENFIISVNWKQEMKGILQERTELLEYRDQHEQAEEHAKLAKIQAAQNALEEEFKELKKMRKQGPPKNPPIPECSTCGQPPSKDMFTHRTTECTERPVQCPKCERILPFSTMEDHKPKCPSRVIQCTGCSNHYKAAYLETVHSGKCADVIAAAEAVERTKPSPPFTVIAPSPVDDRSSPTPSEKKSTNGEKDDEAGGEGVGVKILVNADALKVPSSSLTSPDQYEVFLLSLNGDQIDELSEVEEFLDHIEVGRTVECEVLVVPTTVLGASVKEMESSLDATVSGGGSSQPSFPPSVSTVQLNNHGVATAAELQGKGRKRDVTFIIPACTGMPLSQFQELKFLVMSDVSQYCKPQIERKKGNGKK